MRAVGYRESLPITAEASLIDLDLPKPEPKGRDLLVEVRAVSVNPVDVKVRAATPPEPGTVKVLGWDAAGVVVAAGPEARLFKPGDEVFYAGAIDRSGSNAEFQLVDERIVGPKPASLDFAAAAALPLTTITAWEMLFDRLDVGRPVPGAAPAVLIVGGAGGVGSIAIQLVRALTGLTVIATASRPETRAWVRELGAHHVIDHREPLGPQVEALGLGAPAFAFATTHIGAYLADLAGLVAPQGRIGAIDRAVNLDVTPLMGKSLSFHWELMFTRARYATDDMVEQHRILNRAASLIDAGELRTTHTETLSPICAQTLREAHRRLESGSTIGKLVVAGW